MTMISKEMFVEMMKKIKKCIDVGLDMECNYSEWFNLKGVDHPMVDFGFFMANTMEKIFDEKMVGDWIYDNIVLDENSGFEMWTKSNCGAEKTFYIKDESDIYDYLVWRSKQKNHVDCCGNTEITAFYDCDE